MLCFEKMVISVKFLYFARLEGAGVRREIKCLRRMGKRGSEGLGVGGITGASRLLLTPTGTLRTP